MTTWKSALFLFLALAMFGFAQSPAGPNSGEQEEEEENENVEDKEDDRRFWRAQLPGGHYMVALDRISNISIHEYVLDGSFIVNEVTIDTTGRALARFYHIQPVTDAADSNGITRVVDRGRELIESAGQRVGTDVHNMAQKKYPDTTHAGTIEYRILDIRDLDALYSSVRTSWERGRGRNLTIK